MPLDKTIEILTQFYGPGTGYWKFVWQGEYFLVTTTRGEKELGYRFVVRLEDERFGEPSRISAFAGIKKHIHDRLKNAQMERRASNPSNEAVEDDDDLLWLLVGEDDLLALSEDDDSPEG